MDKALKRECESIEDEKRDEDEHELLGFQMKFMQEAMKDWSEHDANARDKSDAAEERIAAGEEFACGGLDWGERAHTRKNH